MINPRIRRVELSPHLPGGGLWVWGVFRTPTSPKPYLASRNLSKLLATLKQRQLYNKRPPQTKGTK